MALDTYADLKTEIQNYAARSDAQFVARIPTFVKLAEQRMTFGSEEPFKSQPLRTKSQERTDTLTTDANGSVALPADLLEIRAIYRGDSSSTHSKRLTYIEPMEFTVRQDFQVTGGRPINYTVIGNAEDAQFSEGKVFVSPRAENVDLNLLYFTKISPLVNDGDTNWILDQAPTIYLFGSLIEAYTYMRNMEEAQMAMSRYSSACDGLKKTEERSRRQGAPLAPIFSVQ